ncbi:hypothetical protein C2U27_10775 [Bacillus aerophilus]|nr:hypothetical protein [Bacillus aerophilus]
MIKPACVLVRGCTIRGALYRLSRKISKGAHIVLISKALGHDDIDVTTYYLYLDKEDVAKNLGGYL